MITFTSICIGLTLLCASYFQVRLGSGLVSRDRKAVYTAVLLPAAIGAVIVSGTIFVSIADFINETASYRKGDVFEQGLLRTFFAILFALLLILKSVVGPLLGGIVVSYSVYKLSSIGKLEIWPFMEWSISLLISNADRSTAIAYTAVFMIVSIAAMLWRSGGTIDPIDLG